MEGLLDFLLQEGSYLLLFGVLLAAGFGVPISEEVVLIAAGALVRYEVMAFAPTVAVCALGILGGDTVIYLLGRNLGHRVVGHPLLRRFLSREREAMLGRFFARYGALTVFMARHVMGVRMAVWALAGMQRMPYLIFIGLDAAALLLSGPWGFALGYYFADQIELALQDARVAGRLIVIVVVVTAAGMALHAFIRRKMRGNGR
ncbi:MAG: DedA family protein [Candidatus Lambdaproteobacteria bacterium]|nr:DedA family protein [Candidatus Lambdaproteobacteria bacterium]